MTQVTQLKSLEGRTRDSRVLTRAASFSFDESITAYDFGSQRSLQPLRPQHRWAAWRISLHVCFLCDISYRVAFATRTLRGGRNLHYVYQHHTAGSVEIFLLNKRHRNSEHPTKPQDGDNCVPALGAYRGLPDPTVC